MFYLGKFYFVIGLISRKVLEDYPNLILCSQAGLGLAIEKTFMFSYYCKDIGGPWATSQV